MTDEHIEHWTGDRMVKEIRRLRMENAKLRDAFAERCAASDENGQCTMIDPTTILFLIGAYYALKIWVGLVTFAVIGAAVLAFIYSRTDRNGDLA